MMHVNKLVPCNCWMFVNFDAPVQKTLPFFFLNFAFTDMIQHQDMYNIFEKYRLKYFIHNVQLIFINKKQCFKQFSMIVKENFSDSLPFV